MYVSIDDLVSFLFPPLDYPFTVQSSTALICLFSGVNQVSMIKICDTINSLSKVKNDSRKDRKK